MMLRWLVTNYVRQMAQQRVQEAVTEAVRPRDVDDAGARQPIETARPEIVYIFATGIEADALASMLDGKRSVQFPSLREHTGMLDGRGVVVAETGMGAEAARKATAELISAYQPAWVVSAGFAAALVEDVRRGHIVMAEELVDLSGRRLSIGLKVDRESIQAARGLHVGSLLGVDRLISTPEEKRELGQSAGALACDMETIAVAEACREAKTRCLSVRVISDAVSDRLPKEVQNLVAQRSLAGKLGAVTGALLKRPSSVTHMWHLREEATKLSARLAKFLRSITQQLVTDES